MVEIRLVQSLFNRHSAIWRKTLRILMTASAYWRKQDACHNTGIQLHKRRYFDDSLLQLYTGWIAFLFYV